MNHAILFSPAKDGEPYRCVIDHRSLKGMKQEVDLESCENGLRGYKLLSLEVTPINHTLVVKLKKPRKKRGGYKYRTVQVTPEGNVHVGTDYLKIPKKKKTNDFELCRKQGTAGAEKILSLVRP